MRERRKMNKHVTIRDNFKPVDSHMTDSVPLEI